MNDLSNNIFFFEILSFQVEKNTINRELEVSEYQEIIAHCWSRFYSIILQCLEVNLLNKCNAI